MSVYERYLYSHFILYFFLKHRDLDLNNVLYCIVCAEVYCDPLGDHNVFSFVKPLNSSQPLAHDSVTVLAARVSDQLGYLAPCSDIILPLFT